MPKHPTWELVTGFAEELNGIEDGVSGEPCAALGLGRERRLRYVRQHVRRALVQLELGAAGHHAGVSQRHRSVRQPGRIRAARRHLGQFPQVPDAVLQRQGRDGTTPP